MFETLSDRLQQTFKRLSGRGKIRDKDIRASMKDVQMALLEADVNFEIVKDFINNIRTDCLGAEVLKSVSPGQQVIKIVNDRLVELMGDEAVPLDLSRHPSVIMMVGLHGSGKTTTSAKLALNLKKQNKRTILAAADIYRPAAIINLKFWEKK